MTFDDAAAETLRLADIIDAYWAAELPKHHREYPFVLPDEPELPPPPAAAELRRFLDSLDAGQVYALLAAKGVGGVYDRSDEFPKLYRDAVRYHPARGEAARLIVDQQLLPYYLRLGLERLRAAGVNVDRFLASAVTAAA